MREERKRNKERNKERKKEQEEEKIFNLLDSWDAINYQELCQKIEKC